MEVRSSDAALLAQRTHRDLLYSYGVAGAEK
jgi:hypothetical protein